MAERTSQVYIDTKFTFNGKTFKETVELPDKVLLNAFREYSKMNKAVVLESSDNALWNFLYDFDMFQTLDTNKQFKRVASELYEKSVEKAEDEVRWANDKEQDEE